MRTIIEMLALDNSRKLLKEISHPDIVWELFGIRKKRDPMWKRLGALIQSRKKSGEIQSEPEQPQPVPVGNPVANAECGC